MYPSMDLQVLSNIRSTNEFDVQLDPMKALDEAINELKDSYNDIKVLKNDLTYEIYYYFIISAIILFFMYIIVSNLYHTITTYNRNNTQIKTQKQIDVDDNSYYDDDADYKLKGSKNINQGILSGINTNATNYGNNLKQITDFKERENIDSTLYSKINASTLNNANDDYTYIPGNKKEQSFWDLLFEEPKYKHIQNSLNS